MEQGRRRWDVQEVRRAVRHDNVAKVLHVLIHQTLQGGCSKMAIHEGWQANSEVSISQIEGEGQAGVRATDRPTEMDTDMGV